MGILGMHDLGEEHRHEEVPADHKGRFLVTSADGTYCFCARRFISIKAHDHKRIYSRPRVYPKRPPRSLAEELEQGAHMVVLDMARWKNIAQRHSKRCAKCGEQVWATSGFAHTCVYAT